MKSIFIEHRLGISRESAFVGRSCFVLLFSLLIVAVCLMSLPAALARHSEEFDDQAKGSEGWSKEDQPKEDRSEERSKEEQSKDAGEKEETSSNEAQLPTGVITSSQLLHSDNASSGVSLLFEAENAKRYGDLNRALTLVRKSLEIDFGNLDAHAFYAEVLEAKLRKQAERDPDMFRTCIQEWLIVMRNKVGDERGMNIHGIGIPGTGTFYEDEDHTVKARQHLTKLTGYAPRAWETDTKYLKKVLASSSENVSGTVVKKKPPKKDELDFGSK